MFIYASTFISGLQDWIAEYLPAVLPGATIRLLLDGLVVYKTPQPPGSILRLRFFNNSFLVIRQFSDLSQQPIREMATALAQDRNLKQRIAAALAPADTGKTFRLIASVENQLTTLDHTLRTTIERTITGVQRLRVNRSKPDIEFWWLTRREGCGFFLRRLTTHTAYEKTLEKGELRPELAHILCALSEPTAQDIFLDPFCGSGAIPLERATAFPYNLVFATDHDAEHIRRVKQRTKGVRTRQPLLVKQQNALNLQAFEAGFIHKIATDPPWGFFEQTNMDIETFYAQMLQEFLRIVQPDGVIVVLTARKAEFEQAIAAFTPRLQLIQCYHILVSGKKAAIYKITVAKRNS